MFFVISKILAFLIKPIVWIFILLTCAIIFKKRRKKILYLLLFIFYFFTNDFIADRCSMIWETPSKKISSLTNYYKYGIVLGGFSSFNKTTKHINFNASGDRLISAIELYNIGKIKKIIISGGNGELVNDGMKEAEWSKDYLIRMGVKNKDILLESKSRNTMENAQKTSELINVNLSERLLLITSAVHMKRATFCFNKNNLTVESYPTDCTESNIILSFDYLFIPNIKALIKWEILIHELIGYFVYKIKF